MGPDTLGGRLIELSPDYRRLETNRVQVQPPAAAAVSKVSQRPPSSSQTAGTGMSSWPGRGKTGQEIRIIYFNITEVKSMHKYVIKAITV